MHSRRVVARQEVTRRVYLCAPAAFRARRSGGPNERILLTAPGEWARQRQLVERHRRDREATAALFGSLASLPAWQATFSIDTSELLPLIRQQAQVYRVPIGLSLAAGAAALAIGLASHSHLKTPLATVADTIRPPVSSAPKQPLASFAGVTGSVVGVPSHAVKRAKAAPIPRTTLGLANDGTIVVVAQPRNARVAGFDLDITSPGSLWTKAGARYRIDPMLIYAVALVETRGVQPDGSVAPSPWIVRINGHLHGGTRAETEHAIELAHLLAVPVQDVGIMQVYYPMHRDIEPDPIALLNPARNIEVGTRLLRKAMNESTDPVLRIGYYHSHDATLARGYGQLVLNVYRELKLATGKSSSSAVAMALTKTATQSSVPHVL